MAGNAADAASLEHATHVLVPATFLCYSKLSFEEFVRSEEGSQADDTLSDTGSIALVDRSDAFSLDQLGEVSSVLDLLSVDLSSTLDKQDWRSEWADAAVQHVAVSEMSQTYMAANEPPSKL